MHTSSLYHIYHIQIVSPLNLHWNHDFNANFACIYGCVWNKHHSYQNKTSTQNQQCEQMVYRRHEHKMCINNISQVTNVDTCKKERKSTLSIIIIIIIIIITKKREWCTNSNDDQYCCVYKYGNVIACARISLN